MDYCKSRIEILILSKQSIWINSHIDRDSISKDWYRLSSEVCCTSISQNGALVKHRMVLGNLY